MFSMILLIILFFGQVLSSNELTEEECLNLGFRKSQSSCLICEELSKFDLNALKKSCLKCCQNDFNDTKKYSSARLEFCGCPTHSTTFPQTYAFIKSEEKTKKFPNLTIKTVKGSDPVIKLMDDRGVVVNELNINKWDTNTIEEFLSQRLIHK